MSNVRNSFQGINTGHVIQIDGDFYGGVHAVSTPISHAAARAAAAGSTVRQRDRVHTADGVTNAWTGDVATDEVVVQLGSVTIHPASRIEPEPCAVCGEQLDPTAEFCDWCHESRHAD